MIRKVEACLELNVVRDVKGNKKCFCKYVSGRRMTRENMDSLLNGTGSLVTQYVEKVEVLEALFASVSSSKDQGISGAGKMYAWWKRFRSENA